MDMTQHMEMNIALVQEAGAVITTYSLLLQKEVAAGLTVGEKKAKQAMETAIRARQDYLEVYWSISRERLQGGTDPTSDEGGREGPADPEPI